MGHPSAGFEYKAFDVTSTSTFKLGEFRAVIDRKYPLRDIADAYRYVITEQKVGIVVIEVVPEDVRLVG
jgi:hypothetical protein